MPDADYSALEKHLGYQFKNRQKIAMALTHSSTGADLNYERLEFLGDRVLGLVVAELLYQTFPDEREGDMAKRHAALVQGQTIAVIARKVDLGSVMKFSEAERAAGGAENDNILADGMEAVIGALFIDGGLEPCERVIKELWDDTVRTMKKPPQDSKTALQEWAQGRGLPLPVYKLMNRDGPDHSPIFDMAVIVKGYEPVMGSGASRRVAEKEAARLLLEVLEDSE